jgi:hypothetical protein
LRDVVASASKANVGPAALRTSSERSFVRAVAAMDSHVSREQLGVTKRRCVIRRR